MADIDDLLSFVPAAKKAAAPTAPGASPDGGDELVSFVPTSIRIPQATAARDLEQQRAALPGEAPTAVGGEYGPTRAYKASDVDLNEPPDRPETTRLSRPEERRFQEWARTNNLTDVDHPDSHYDYRGFWKATGGAPHPPGDQLHFPDTFKQHGHPTFSVESQYSKGPTDGGRWEGDTFLPAGTPSVPPGSMAFLERDGVHVSPREVAQPAPTAAQFDVRHTQGRAPLPARPVPSEYPAPPAAPILPTGAPAAAKTSPWDELRAAVKMGAGDQLVASLPQALVDAIQRDAPDVELDAIAAADQARGGQATYTPAKPPTPTLLPERPFIERTYTHGRFTGLPIGNRDREPDLSTVYDPITEGATHVVRGLERVAPAFTGDTGGTINPPPSPSRREVLGGAAEAIGGGFELATPFAVGGLLTEPLATVAVLVSGTAAQVGTEKTATALGASPETSRFAGNLAALIAGHYTAKGVGAYTAAKEATVGAADARARQAAAETLGVEPNADEAAIKAAYRDYVKANHPDVNPNTDAQAFTDVTLAYDWLREHPAPPPTLKGGDVQAWAAEQLAWLKAKTSEALNITAEELDQQIAQYTGTAHRYSDMARTAPAARPAGPGARTLAPVPPPADESGRPLGGPSTYAGEERRGTDLGPPGDLSERRRAELLGTFANNPHIAERHVAAAEAGRAGGIPTPAETRAMADKLDAAGMTLAAQDYRRMADEREAAAAKDLETFTPADAEEHKFSSTQLNLPEPIAGQVTQLAETIPDKDLAKDGRETTPHVTLKYGLHTEDVDEVRAVLAGAAPIPVTLGKTSVFPDSGHGDVVKIDVDSPELHALNATISAALEATDTHPEYQPHVTVAYVKPGKGEQYAGDASLEGQTITLDTVRFSMPDGSTVDIPLGGSNAAPLGQQPQGGVGEHRGADANGQVPAEASGGHRPVERPPASVEGPLGGAPSQEDIGPDEVTLETPTGGITYARPTRQSVQQTYRNIQEPPDRYYDLENNKRQSAFPPGLPPSYYDPFIEHFAEREQTARAQFNRYDTDRRKGKKTYNGQIVPSDVITRWRQIADGWKEALRVALERQERANQKLSAEPEGLGSALYFRSGVKNAPADFDGFAKAAVPVGITADGATQKILDRAAAYVKSGGLVFVDSGAFGAFTGKRPIDFDGVLATYDKLATAAGQTAGNLYVVAPDVVGDAFASQDLQAQYADRLEGLMAQGVKVIIPIQRDTANAKYSLGRDLNEVYGMYAGAKRENLVFGIPFNKAAFSAEEVAAALKEFHAEHPDVAPRVHLLGIGEKNRNYGPALKAIRAASPKVQLSADSNRIAALFAAGRPATTATAGKVEHRAPNHVDTTPGVDTTELTAALFVDKTIEGFTPTEIERMAAATHIPLTLLPKVVREGRLQAALDHRGTEQALDLEIYQIALDRSRKAVRPGARTDTIAETETTGHPIDEQAQAVEEELRTDFDKMTVAEMWPADTETVRAAALAKGEQIPVTEAEQRIASWKAEAKRIGATEDHSHEVVISLFDRTGTWSQPYVDAGYTVIRYDTAHGDDLLAMFPMEDLLRLRNDPEMTIVGVLAAPPCTSYAVSGARWWESQHDQANEEMVEKKYGYEASKYFDTPLDYANTLVKSVELVLELAKPTQFHAMENPVGRIAEQNELPAARLIFDPNNFGDPYTKKTLLWGVFNPDLPTANVVPSKGSYVATLRGDVPEQKTARSITPEGFAYAFFMANHQAPSAAAGVGVVAGGYAQWLKPTSQPGATPVVRATPVRVISISGDTALIEYTDLNKATHVPIAEAVTRRSVPLAQLEASERYPDLPAHEGETVPAAALRVDPPALREMLTAAGFPSTPEDKALRVRGATHKYGLYPQANGTVEIKTAHASHLTGPEATKLKKVVAEYNRGEELRANWDRIGELTRKSLREKSTEELKEVIEHIDRQPPMPDYKDRVGRELAQAERRKIVAERERANTTAAPATSVPPVLPPAAAGANNAATAAQVTYNSARHSVEVKFPAKPAQETLDALKRAGYKWAKTNKVWYRKLTPASTEASGLAHARKILGIEQASAGSTSAPVPKPSEPVTFEVRTITGEKRPDITLPAISSSMSPGAAAALFEANQPITYQGKPGHVASPAREPGLRGDLLRIVLDEAPDRVTFVDARQVEPAPTTAATTAEGRRPPQTTAKLDKPVEQMTDEELAAAVIAAVDAEQQPQTTVTPGITVSYGSTPVSGKKALERKASPPPAAKRAPAKVGPPARTYDRGLAQRTFTQFKSALTRVLNAAEQGRTQHIPPPAQIARWTAVRDEAQRFLNYYEGSAEPWPDDWHRWQRAKEDAEYQLQRLAPDAHDQAMEVLADRLSASDAYDHRLEGMPADPYGPVETGTWGSDEEWNVLEALAAFLKAEPDALHIEGSLPTQVLLRHLDGIDFVLADMADRSGRKVDGRSWFTPELRQQLDALRTTLDREVLERAGQQRLQFTVPSQPTSVTPVVAPAPPAGPAPELKSLIQELKRAVENQGGGEPQASRVKPPFGDRGRAVPFPDGIGPLLKAWYSNGVDAVVAKSPIRQSPLSGAPTVPPGRPGRIQDYDTTNRMVYVDFGDPYGTVMTEERELAPNRSAEPKFARATLPGFYSALGRAIDRKMPAKASPEQILNIAKNPQNGVKADELKWSGLEAWLGEQGGAVSKADVKAFLATNGLQVEEVERGEPDFEDDVAVIQQHGYDVEEDDPNVDPHLTYRHDGEPVDESVYLALPKPVLEAYQRILDKNANQPRYGAHVVPGGQHYRELLITLPGESAKPEDGWRVITKEEYGEKHPIDQHVGDLVVVDRHGEMIASGMTRERALGAARTISGLSHPAEFTTGHWDEPNVLVHVRFNDRVDAQGRKVLFLEEVQSDWHQKGRKQGYRGDVDMAEIDRLKEASRDARAALRKRQDEMSAEHGGKMFGLNQRQSEELQQLEAADREADEAYRAARDKGAEAVPDAPFKTTWPELAVKRMIRYAAEHGYDVLAWTPGEVQNERYSLEKAVKEVRWGVFEQPTRETKGPRAAFEQTFWNRGARKEILIIPTGGGGEFTLYVNPQGKIVDVEGGDHTIRRLVGRSIDDAVGKELGERLMNVPFGKLAGEGLKIGGKGMVGFYDKILPDFVNKYAKPWGAKVEDVALGPQAPSHLRVETLYDGGDARVGEAPSYGIWDDKLQAYWQNGEAGVRTFPTRTAAEAYLMERASERGEGWSRVDTSVGPRAMVAHGVAITPAMRDSVMANGQPLFARTEAGKVRAGIGDEGAAARIMASSLYGKATPEVATKELLQNAFDAVKPKGSRGEIDVRFYAPHGAPLPGGKHLEVQDNGAGMTREELETVFTDLFSSGKRADSTAAGGFGIAKASFLYGGEKVEVETVVETNPKESAGYENGRWLGFLNKGESRKVRYTFTATPAELESQEGVAIHEAPVPAETSTGTRIRTYLKPDASTWTAEMFAREIAKHSVGLAGTYRVWDVSRKNRTTPIAESKPIERVAFTTTWKRYHLEMPGAKVTIYAHPETDAATSVAMGRILNNGVYQFDQGISTAPPGHFAGPKLALQKNYLIDLQATVPEGDPAYPFTANREQLRDQFANELRPLLYQALIAPVADHASHLLQHTYDTLRPIDLGRAIAMVHPRPLVLLDSGKRLTNAELDQIFTEPAVQRVVEASMRVLDRVLSKLLGEMAPRVERIGILFDGTVGDDVGTHGVYIPNPATVGTAEPKATILINPFEWLLRHPTPDAAAAAIYHTSVHEATHFEVGDHNEAFTVTLADHVVDLGARFEITALQEVMTAYGDPTNLDQLDPGVARALSLYQASRRRAVVEADALSGTGRRLPGSADAPPGEGGVPDGARRDRGRAAAPAQVTPQTVTLMVKILRHYLGRGMTHFPDVAQLIVSDFAGEGVDARSLDRHVEVAWKMLRQEQVSVAAALAEAQNTSREATDGGDVHRSGRPAERGEPTARGGGTADQSALGTVPADAGGGPAAAGAGGPGAGPSDSAEVLGAGIQRDEAPSGQPGDGSGPGDHDRGGAAPGRALSPAGDTADPGPKPPDYVYTPERLATISARGPMARARDNLAALKIVKALREEHRYPTPAEQDTLARYVGWGDSEVAQYLHDSKAYTWRGTETALWQEIRDFTTPEERLALQHSTLNAHYTYDLYRAIWPVLEAAGFTSGRVLEPAVGTGHAFGSMPAAMREASTLNAVELEPITAAIAQALFPSARVQALGYEQARIARGTQDLVISNVPFGDYGVIDPTYKDFLTESIHNYFFARALDHVRPGGLIVFVTSRYTLDGPEATQVRRYIGERAHFVGAARLPMQAFEKTANTEVITDLIVLQRLREGETAKHLDLFIEAPRNDALSSTQYRKGKMVDKHVYRTKWYDAHPELILGTESNTGTMYGKGQYNVEAPKGANVPALLAKALAQILPPGSYQAATSTITEPPAETETGRFKIGEFRFVDGKILRLDRDGNAVDATPTRFDKTKNTRAIDQGAVDRIVGLIDLRDTLRELIATMQDREALPSAIQAGQQRLTKKYDAFTKKYGELNGPLNKRLFKDDPEAANLLGLEKVKPETSLVTNKTGKQTLRVRYKVVGKHDIFEKRTINAPVEITHADTPHDALLASLGVQTRIDWKYMGRITGQPVATLQAALKADGRVFEQPDGSWVLADEYLSGDVVTKLVDAEAAAVHEPARFTANIEALKAVQPAPKTPESFETGEVSATLGTHWVPKTHFLDFLATTLDLDRAKVGDIHLAGTSTFLRWQNNFTTAAEHAGQQHDLAVPYGPSKRYIYGLVDLVKDALNLQMPDLGWYEGSGDDRKYIKDPEGTTAARANLEELRSRWTQWLFERPDVQTELLQIYNTRFNRTVARRFDGSHLLNIKDGQRTPALPGLAIAFALFPHQTNMVWRILTAGNSLAAHEVGAGKTLELIVAAMEMRRTGRARKPLITVPTNLLGQWRQAIVTAYPTAKVLAFDETDLAKPQRQQAMARIAYGDWDIVLVPHSSFQLLKVSDARMVTMFRRWVDELLDAEAEAKHSRGDDDDSVKQMAKVRAKIEKKIAKKMEAINKGSDNGLTWEQLGVDALMVDEAQAFKNLYFFSKIENLRGLSRSEADRSLDLYIKVQDINEDSRERNLVLATATPVMNAMAEVFTMQRYLQPTKLEEMGVENFDNWYALFAKALPTTEQRPDGSYQEVMRLKEFSNLDLLYRAFAEVMDYVGWDDMPYLKLPTLEGGKVEIVQHEPHPMYPLLKKWFEVRLANIRATPPHTKVNRFTGDKEYIAPPRPDPFTGEPIPGKVDNILTIMNDAGLAAVDARLVLGHKAADYPGSRMQLAAKRIVQVYKAETKRKGAILAFLDVGIPRKHELGPLEFLKGVAVEDTTEGGALGTEDETLEGEEDEGGMLTPDEQNGRFNLYDYLKALLVKQGIPSREIAYVHQARNATERLALFDAVNDGRVRVLFASTDKGSVGMNIQERLKATLHLDAPIKGRPGDIQQRRGRMIRQGNTYPEVSEVRYVAKGTTDEWRYGMLAQKSAMTQQFMRGKLFAYRDEDPNTMSIEEAQVRATGDPRGIELTELRASLNRLKAQAAAADRTIGQARADVTSQTKRIAANERSLAHLEAWLTSAYTPMRGEAFAATIGGTAYAKRAEANTRLLKEMVPLLETEPESGVVIGEIGGLPIEARYDYNSYYRERSVQLWINADAAGEGSIWATAVPEPKKGEAFGLGRNVVQSLVDKYQDLPGRVTGYRREIEQATEILGRAEKLLAKPPDASAKLRAVAARISALEAELKTESAERDKALEQERQQRISTAKQMPSNTATDDEVDALPASGGGGPVPTQTGPTTVGPQTPLSAREQRELRPDEIVTRLAEAIGNLPISVGQTHGNRAVFKRQGAIREQMAGDFFARLHEIGHALDRLVINFSSIHHRGAIGQELRALGAPTSKPSYDAARRRAEGVAEYTRRWLMDPASVRADAPEFTLAFEAFIGSGHPVAQALAEAQSAVQLYLALTPGEQFDLMIDFGDGRLPAWMEQSVAWALGTYQDPRTGWSRLIAAVSDDKYRLWEIERALTRGEIDPGQSVYWLARMLPGAARRAEGFIRFKVRDGAGTVLGPGLSEAIEPHLGKYRTIVKFMVAKRAERARERGVEPGFSPQQIAAWLGAGDDPDVQAAVRGINAFRGAYLDYLEGEGYLPHDMRQKWERAWGDTYIPFKRISQAMEPALRGAAAQPRTQSRRARFMKRFGGSFQPIADPIVTLLEDTYDGVTKALENRFLNELLDLVDQPNGAQYLELIDQPKLPVTFNLAVLKNVIVDELAANDIEIPDSVLLDETFLDQLVTVWTPQKFTGPDGKHYVSALKPDGTRRWAQVHDQGLWELLDRYNARNTSTFVTIMSWFAKPLRATATLNLPWMLRNLAKDYVAANAYSPQGYSVANTVSGFLSVVREDEFWQLYLHSLAGQSTFNAQDRDVFKRQLARLTHAGLRRFFDLRVFHPWDTLAALRELSEQATRVGAMKRQLKAEEESPDGLTEAGLRRMGIVGREVTQDFTKMGSAVRDPNRMTAFLGARIGGTTKFAEEVKTNPRRLASRLWPYAVLVAALWLINSKDDEYDAIDPSEKNLYHHIPVPQALRDQGWGPFVRVARPFEFGQIANLIEGFLAWQVQHDPQGKQRLPQLDFNALMDLILSLSPTVFVPVAEVAADYDFYFQRNLIRPEDRNLDPELQYNRWTPESAKRLAGVFNTPPWMIDHLLNSYFSRVYSMTAGSLDSLLGPAGQPAAPDKLAGVPGPLQGVASEAVRAFYGGAEVGHGDIDAFYTELTRLEGAARSIRDYVKRGDPKRAAERAAEEGLRVTIPAGTTAGAIPKEIEVTSPRLTQLRKTRQQLTELRGPIDALYRDPTMSSADKAARLAALGEQMENMTRQALGKPPLTRTLRRAQLTPAGGAGQAR